MKCRSKVSIAERKDYRSIQFISEANRHVKRSYFVSRNRSYEGKPAYDWPTIMSAVESMVKQRITIKDALIELGVPRSAYNGHLSRHPEWRKRIKQARTSNYLIHNGGSLVNK